MKLTDFVPKDLRSSRKTIHSAKIILRLDAIIFILACCFIPVFYSIDFPLGARVMMITLALTIVHPMIMYFSNNTENASHFYALSTLFVFSSLAAGSGGVHSSFIFWLITIPPISLLFFKKPSYIFWVSISLLAIVTIAALGTMDLLPTSNISDSARMIIDTANIILLCSVFIYLIQGFKSSNQNITKKLEKVNVRLQASNAELERFASIASHDLKSPLRNITGFMGLFRKRYGADLDEKANEFLNIIEGNSNTMSQLIEDILEYSRANGTSLRKEKVNLNKVLAQIKTQMTIDSSYAKATVKLDLLPVINTDPTRILQVFQNLIENGLKYNRNEKPKVEVRYHARNNQHNFEVIDNGIGIDSKHLNKVFEMFQRLHGQSEFKGSGIGLATTKRSIEAMGGTIKIVSAVGRGSTFRIQIPMSPEDFMPTQTEIRADPAEMNN